MNNFYWTISYAFFLLAVIFFGYYTYIALWKSTCIHVIGATEGSSRRTMPPTKRSCLNKCQRKNSHDRRKSPAVNKANPVDISRAGRTRGLVQIYASKAWLAGGGFKFCQCTMLQRGKGLHWQRLGRGWGRLVQHVWVRPRTVKGDGQGLGTNAGLGWSSHNGDYSRRRFQKLRVCWGP